MEQEKERKKETGNKKKIIVGIFLTLLVLLGASYAWLRWNIEGKKKISIASGDLTLELDESETTSDIITLEDIYPIEDNEGKKTEGYKFKLINHSSVPITYELYLENDEGMIEECKTQNEDTCPLIADRALRYSLNKNGKEEITSLSDGRLIDKGTIKAGATNSYELHIWINIKATNEDAAGKYFFGHLNVKGEQNPRKEEDESGANAPELGNEMIPVKYDGYNWVKADTEKEWYNYEKKQWANAVILVDNPSKRYQIGEEIKESDIESYFVWIPRYKYQIFNDGNYETALNEKKETGNAKTIQIKFQGKEDDKEQGSKEGQWLTHPAFTLGGKELSGIWVGKFETGYNQSGNGTEPINMTSGWTTGGAQINSNNPDKVIVKPNVYSWRSINVHNIFLNAYNYKRELGSHMMKNTEWGAVAYLSHSKYGINKEININNNATYKTGYSATSNADQSDHPGKTGTDETKTLPYDNKETGYLASTTGNITGIYDMSGGAWEYMAAYMEGYGVTNSEGVESGFSDTELNATYVAYLDKYLSNSNQTSYKNRILGDATGEMGPFYNYQDGDSTSRYHNAWYQDYSNFVEQFYPWFMRGGDCSVGVLAGQFHFHRNKGDIRNDIGSRLVLALKE